MWRNRIFIHVGGGRPRGRSMCSQRQGPFLGFRPVQVCLCGKAVEDRGVTVVLGRQPVSNGNASVGHGRLFVDLRDSLVNSCCLIVSPSR
jgi:hypothetical protein